MRSNTVRLVGAVDKALAAQYEELEGMAWALSSYYRNLACLEASGGAGWENIHAALSPGKAVQLAIVGHGFV